MILPRPSRVPLLIPVGVSNDRKYYLSDKNITLNELMRINDICRSQRSDQYMSTKSAINHLQININGILLQYHVRNLYNLGFCTSMVFVLPR